MLKIVAAVIVLLLGGAVTANAASPLDAWAADVGGLVKSKEGGIDELKAEGEFRCPKQKEGEALQKRIPYETTCDVAYRVIVLRREVAKAELELMLKALELEPADRERLLKSVVPWEEYNQFDERTTGKRDVIRAVFPKPKPKPRQSSQR